MIRWIFQAIDNFGEDRGRIKFLHLKHEASGGDATDIQHVIDQFRKAGYLGRSSIKPRDDLLRWERIPAAMRTKQSRHRQMQRIQRIAQLMRDG